jgi:hypothetical protein
MDRLEACRLIEAIRDSVVNAPSQFHFTVNVTGQKIESHGGTGLKITAMGGGPGSTTIGQKLSLDVPHIEIAQQKGNAAIHQQMQNLVDDLSELAEQLKTVEPDKRIISSVYEKLKQQWIPDVITSVVGCAVAKWIGL